MITLHCQQPGCDRTNPGVAGIDWTCPAHSPAPVWPAAHEPCSDDCDGTCYQEDDGTWVFETTRENGWGGDEDVQALCPCEHHRVATNRERINGIGFRIAPLPGPSWDVDPLASRATEARTMAGLQRHAAFVERWYRDRRQDLSMGVHPGRVQAIGGTPVWIGDERYVAAWAIERERGIPAWPKPCDRYGPHECDPNSGPGADECWGPRA